MRSCFNSPLVASLGVVAGLSLAAPAWPEESSVTVGVAYTADLLHNTRGGLARGGAYLDNLDVTVHLDGERLWNIEGFELYAAGLYNNSATFSDRYSGDAFITSSIDTDRAVRLFEAWGQWTLGPNAQGSIKAGLYDLNSEFDTTPARGLFMNSVYGIGQDFAQSGQNGPSIFPSTSLAVRGSWTLSESSSIKLAVLDGVPGDPDDPSRTRVDLSSDDGALIVAEYTTARGRMTQLSIGYWRYTADFEDVLDTTASGAPRVRSDNQGLYGTAEFMLSDRLTAFARLGAANRHLNAFDRFYAAGFVWNGVLPGSVGDQLGLAVSGGRASGPFRAAASSTSMIDGHEYNAELTWRIPINDWLVLQPDLQYVIDPGLDSSLRNAFIIGLRVELARDWTFNR